VRHFCEKILGKIKPQIPAVFMLLVLSAFFSLNSAKFFSTQNFLNIMDQTAGMCIMAVGLTFVMIGGHFDLSGGSTIALVGVICAQLLIRGTSVWLTILIGIVCGGLIGLFNGFCIAKLKLASFIMTLTTSIMMKGVALAITGGRTIYDLPAAFCFWGSGKLGDIPVALLLVGLLFIGFQMFLSRTVFGHQVYAVGENREAAGVAGIRTSQVTIITFILAGCLYAVAAITLTGRLQAAVSTNGLNMEMTALSALAIGGISMAGGRGNLVGTFLGCLIIGIVSNGLNLLNLSPYYAEFIRGLVIFGALLLEAIRVIVWKRQREQL